MTSRLVEPSFWTQPLNDRMHELIAIREHDPIAAVDYRNDLADTDERFYALTRHADIVAVSKDAKTYSSASGAVSVIDMPTEALEFFGSFINMDNPRHMRQRAIVSRSFTPRDLEKMVQSVEAIVSEVIDDFCEDGEADLVEVMSQPFPLLVICDMMGIPRSEFQTVLDATNVILGGGDPEFVGEDDPLGALLGAGMELTALMNEVSAARKLHPTDDLTSKLVHTDLDGDTLAPEEVAPFFILLAVAGNDTTRTALSHGMNLLSQFPEQRAIWQRDVDAVTTTAVEEIVRYSAPVTFMRRTVTTDTELSGHTFVEGDKVVMLYGAANRDPLVFDDPEVFDVQRNPNPHLGFGGPGPHFCLGANLARRELAVAFRQLFERLPDIEVAGDAVPLDVRGLPLVSGIKRLPVRFAPAARLGAA
ncbi:MAG: cytochrome P450 [Actinomycetota bacterium]